MSESKSPIPTDIFSTELRKLTDNPGAFSSQSTIRTQDFYGNLMTWVIETFRDDDNAETLFLQWHTPEGGHHLVVPSLVLATLARQHDQLATRARRRLGHRLIALRKERGDVLGNVEALRKARKARKKAKK